MKQLTLLVLAFASLNLMSGCADINRKPQSERFSSYRESESYRNYITQEARKTMPEEWREKKNCMLVNKQTGLAVVEQPIFPKIKGLIPTKESDPLLGIWVEKQVVSTTCFDKPYGIEVAARGVPYQRPVLLFRYTKGVKEDFYRQWSDAEAKYWYNKLNEKVPAEYKMKPAK